MGVSVAMVEAARRQQRGRMAGFKADYLALVELLYEDLCVRKPTEGEAQKVLDLATYALTEVAIALALEDNAARN